MIMKSILFALAFLLSAAQAEAVYYWAKNDGNNSATCTDIDSADADTEPASFGTIARAAACATASGDNVFIKPGTYTTNTNISNLASGVSVRGSDSSPANWPVIQPSSGSIWLNYTASRSNNSFQFLRIYMVNSGANTCMLWNINQGSTILDFPGMAVRDVECKGPATAIAAGTAAGFKPYNSHGIIFSRVHVHSWRTPLGNPGAHGFYWQAYSGVIENSIIENVDGYCLQFYRGGAAVNGNTYRKNVCRDRNFAGQGGVYSGASDIGNQIIESEFYNVGGTRAIQVGSHVKVEKNTIYYPSGGVGIAGGGGACTVKNNIIHAATPTSGLSSCTVSNNLTSLTPGDVFTDHANGDLSLKSTATGAINQGTSSPFYNCNGTCDIGAHESIPTTVTATSTDSSIDIAFGMSIRVPLLPASGITGFTLSNGRTVTSATRLSDSIVRLTYSGSCTGGTFSYSGGNLTDSALIGNEHNQPFFAITNHAITNSCGGGTPTPPAGLHVHYKLDDGSGTNANDETANNLDGTLSNSPSWVTGRTGGALEFANGVQDQVAVPYGNTVNPSTQSLTIAFDFQPTTSGTTEGYFGSNNGTNQRLYIAKRPNDTMSIGIQSSAAGDNTEFPVVVGTWYRACLVMNSGTDIATLHLNGVAGTTAESVKAYTSYALASDFTIGRFSGNTDSLPGVIIDNFKLWTSAESCADDYAAEWPPAPPTTSTFTQIAARAYLLRTNSSGDLIPLAAVNTAVSVPSGASIAIALQVDEDNVANPDALSMVLQHDLNAGGFGDTPNTLVGNAAFYGTSDTHASIVSGAPAQVLSGALTLVSCGTQRLAEAIPVVDLGQNNSTVCRYLVTVAGSVGDQIRFRLRNQNGNALDTYSQYMTVNIVGAYAGVGF